jgi:hypothetical protein
MKVFGNWDDLVEKCRKQDEMLKRTYAAIGSKGHRKLKSWYDIISESMDEGLLEEVQRRNGEDA